MRSSLFMVLGICLGLVSGLEAFANEKKREPSSFPGRPPQFVLFAFDGSLNLDFWRESTQFAETVATLNTENQSQKLRFTYFINPVYYLEAPYKSAYTTPGLNKPVSCIGWSSPANSFADRIKATNKAFDLGHEIGSHANSHCDQSGVDPDNPMHGKRWGESEWSSEFDQFNKIIFNLAEINKKSADVTSFRQENIVGFRAPLLAYTEGLWPTLKRFNFRYDTSKSAEPTYWPQKMTWGGWNMPLGEIKVAGTTKKTLSMDYNWFYFQSGGVSIPNMKPDQRAKLKKQVLDSYKYYFKTNYFGGRAPVQIGHHFSKWNDGIYWEAMQELAKFVCSRKEVHCVTMKEYGAWLDGLPPDIYAKYRSGKFDKLPDDNTIQPIATPVLADVRLDIGNDAYEAMVSETDKARMKIMKWKLALQVNFETQPKTRMTRDEVLAKVPKGSTALIRASLLNASGAELSWQTYKVENIGTDVEKISERPLEDRALQGEGSDAHEETP